MTAVLLALATLLLGYLAGRTRPLERLGWWADDALDATGWRRRAACAVLAVDVAVHPVRSRLNWRANRAREQTPTAVAFDPNWSKTKDPDA